MTGTSRRELVEALDKIATGEVVQFSDTAGKPHVQLRLESGEVTAGVAIVDQLGLPVKEETLTYRLYEGPDYNVMLVTLVDMQSGMLLVAREALTLLERLGDAQGYEVIGSREPIPGELDSEIDWDAIADDYPAGTLPGYIVARVWRAARECTFAHLPEASPAAQVLAALLADTIAELGWQRDEQFDSEQIDETISVLEAHTRAARALEPNTINITVRGSQDQRGRG